MSKTINIDYDEYLAMQDEIKKLKEQNSMLCQGASVVESVEIRIYGNYGLNFHFDKSYMAIQAISDAEKLVDVCGKLVAKGAKQNTYFSGIETLEYKLMTQIKTMKIVMDRFKDEK